MFEPGARKRILLAALFAIGAILPLNVFFYFDPVSLRDFNNIWVSGHAVRQGLDPYDLQAFKALGDKMLGVANYNFTYPPHALFLFLPFSFLPPVPALILWNAASAAVFWWAARPWIPKGMPTVLAIATPGALISLNYGQTGLISSALFLLAFRGSGLAAAILTMKPHLGFLVLPALLRDRRALATAAICTAALIGASAIMFGGWSAFFAHARDFQARNLTDMSEIAWMVKGTTPAIGYGLWGWAAFAAAAALILSRNFNVFTAATATFLISPYGLHYDMAALCLGFGVLLHSRWDVMPPDDKIAASLAFLTPALVVHATTWAIPPILIWGLLVQAKWTDGVCLRIRARAGQKGIQLRLAPVGPNSWPPSAGRSQELEPALGSKHLRH